MVIMVLFLIEVEVLQGGVSLKVLRLIFLYGLIELLFIIKIVLL